MTAPTKKRTRGKTRRTVKKSEPVVVLEPGTLKYLGWGLLVQTIGGKSK